VIDSIRVVHPVTFDGEPSYRKGTRPAEVGDHVLTEYGWGVVVKISEMGRGMYVDCFKLRPDPGRQDFPEYELMERAERKVRIADWPIAEICEAKLNSPLGSKAGSRPSEDIHRARYPA
jgi:hypothetical protein